MVGAARMRRSRSSALFVVVLALVVAGALEWWPGAPGPSPRAGAPTATTGPTAAAGAVPRSRPRTTGEVRARTPAFGRILIPVAGVRAPVITLGLNPDRTLQVPARSDQTGWWKGGAYPGQPGPAVIVGHVDSTRGPAVFFGLRRLRPGDRVSFVTAGRAPARFVVDRLESVSKGRFPSAQVYRATRGAQLRLITCTGSFDRSSGHYESNLIVFAHLIRGRT